jgi:hypothetical protein
MADQTKANTRQGPPVAPRIFCAPTLEETRAFLEQMQDEVDAGRATQQEVEDPTLDPTKP